MRACAIVLCVLAFAVTPLHATTIRVDGSGGGDFLTIQEGIDNSFDGDTVLVAAGTYSGENNYSLDFVGLKIVLMSEEGAENTIIDCHGLGKGITLDSEEDSTAVIQGFTIKNASGTNGAGIRAHDASPLIKDCIIMDCTGNNGAGIYVGYNQTPGAIRDCKFYGNSANWRGGGLHGDNCDAPIYITNCTFVDNRVTSAGHITNGGGAIASISSPLIIRNCTLVENSCNDGAGGILCFGSGPEISNCVIAFSTEGNAVGEVSGGPSICAHNVIYGNAGGDSVLSHPDNIHEDPLFCDTENPDEPYSVHADSPCLSSNNTWGEDVGAYGSGCPSPAEPASWGAVKGLLR